MKPQTIRLEAVKAALHACNFGCRAYANQRSRRMAWAFLEFYK